MRQSEYMVLINDSMVIFSHSPAPSCESKAKNNHTVAYPINIPSYKTKHDLPAIIYYV